MQIGFIDFSKEERNKILATLKLLGTQTALDELGIGVIRDAYADILFPGISTIQTRAKYFVLIPYLFERAANQKLSSGRELYKWLTANEDKMVETLVRNSDSEETGIIGKNALKQKRAVKMKPSSIYWNGLRTFEIVRNAGISLSAACNVTWSSAQKKNEAEPKTDGDTFDDLTAGQGNSVLFSPILPDYDFEKKAAITLTRKEAEFLADKITKALLSKNTLLAFLIKHKLNCSSFDEIPADILPHEMRHDYLLAKDFSDFIIGAHIRYNIIFSDYQDEEMMDEFNSWRTTFVNRDFDLAAVLDRISCNYATTKFCVDFLDSVYKNDLQAMDELIVAREKAVKDDRAKLCKPKEYQYNYDRPVHFYRLDFRFGTAKTIIDDIIKGLEG
ncbi:MAG: hypothetical protein C4550_05095 [Nitrospiraceae bacterium]|nr:MAG: hypothetical protein C4550_05095 [Nitrospiraceae bacterium]